MTVCKNVFTILGISNFAYCDIMHMLRKVILHYGMFSLNNANYLNGNWTCYCEITLSLYIFFTSSAQELEQVEDVWRGEVQDLLSQIRQLQAENKTLLVSLSLKDCPPAEEDLQKQDGGSSVATALILRFNSWVLGGFKRIYGIIHVFHFLVE